MTVELFDIDVALILKQNVHIPGVVFEQVKRFYEFVLNLDLNKIPFVEQLKSVKKYTELDYRIQYLILNILIPLALTLVTLVLFQQIYVIIWYFLILIGGLCIIVGLFAFLLPSQSYSLFMSKIWPGSASFPIQPELLLIIVGVIVVCLCGGVGLFVCTFTGVKKSVQIRRHRRIMDIQNARKKIREDALNGKVTDVDAREKLKKGKITKTLKAQLPKAKITVAELNVQREEVLSFSMPRVLINLLCVGMMLGAGLFMLQIVKLEYFGWENNIIDQTFGDPSIVTFSRIFGVITIIAGFFTLIQTMFSCCECGRKFEYNLIKCCKVNMLKVVMLVLTTIYTPVVTSLVSSLLCHKRECPMGTRFPVAFNTLSLDTLLDASEGLNDTMSVCQECIFHIASNCSIVNELCPMTIISSLDTQRNIDCADIRYFFIPATAMLIITFVIGIPVFFFIMTCRSSQKLTNMEVDFLCDRYVPLWIRQPKKAQNLLKKYKGKDVKAELAKLKPPKNATDVEFLPPSSPPELIKRRKFEMKKGDYKKISRKLGDERWLIRTSLTQVPCRSLYFAFESKFRYFKMINLVFKLVLVIVSTTMMEQSQASLGAQMGVHLIFSLAMLLTFPYNDWFLDVFQIIASCVLAVDAIYIFINSFYQLPEWVFYPIFALNVLLVPVLSIVIFFWSFVSKKKFTKQYKKLIQKMQLLQKQGIINIQSKFNFRGIHKNMEDTDELVNSDNMKMVLVFFMILGISTFISFACVTLGLLYGEFNPKYIPNQYDMVTFTPQPTAASHCAAVKTKEFAGYESWEEFTDNCCCAQSVHHQNSAITNHFSQVEMWYCVNGNRKERVRSLFLEDDTTKRDVLVNGTVVRDFCSPFFNDGFELLSPCFHNETAGYSVVIGSEGSLQHDDKTDQKYNVRKFYW